MRFDNPAWFLLLLVLPLLFIRRRKIRPAGIRYPSIEIIPEFREGRMAKLARVIFPLLRFGALALVIAALARPVTVRSEEAETIEGVDIILITDVSSSMTAKDLGEKSRLDYAKEVIKDFIAKRPDDQIGLVVFSGRAFTQAPLTIDHDILLSLVDQMKTGMIEDGTAIGMAIGTAVNRLKDSKAKSKVAILLTDGENNAGVIDPMTAAQIAQMYGIRVYTIGVGSKEGYRFTVRDPSTGQLFTGVYSFNEDLLKDIARTTTGSDGNYFNATSAGRLKEIYDRINRLEKTEIEVKHYEKKTELFVAFAMIAALLLIAEVALAETIFRRIPA